MCKYNIYVSNNAKQDLLNIRCYITNVIGAQMASNNLLITIDKAIFSFEKIPHRCSKISNNTIKNMMLENYS